MFGPNKQKKYTNVEEVRAEMLTSLQTVLKESQNLERLIKMAWFDTYGREPETETDVWLMGQFLGPEVRIVLTLSSDIGRAIVEAEASIAYRKKQLKTIIMEECLEASRYV